MDLPGSEPPDLHAQLAAQLAAVEAQLDAQKAAHRQAIKARDLEIEKLKHQLAGMRRHRFGSSSESLEQLELSLEEVELAAAAEEPPEPQAGSETKAPAKKKPKRAPLPSHLPRTDEVLSPGEACTCGGHLRAIGEDVTEELEYIPGRFVVPDHTPAPGLHRLRGDHPGRAAVAADRARPAGTGPVGPCAGVQICRSLAVVPAIANLPA